MLAVEVEEGGARLAAALAAHGLRVQTDDGRVLVALDDERTFDLVRDATVDLGLALVRLEQRRHRLEDLFREPDAAEPAAGHEGPAATGTAEADGRREAAVNGRAPVGTPPARPPPGASTTWATGATRARGSAGGAPSRPSTPTACAPASGSAGPAGRRSCPSA